MKKAKVLLIFGILVSVAGCTFPTTVTKTITEVTDPDGKKTVSVTRSMTQHVEVSRTSSTDEIVKTFDK